MSGDELAPPPKVDIGDDGASVDFGSGNTHDLCAWLTSEACDQYCEKVIEAEVDCETFYRSTTFEREQWGVESKARGGTSLARKVERHLRDLRSLAWCDEFGRAAADERARANRRKREDLQSPEAKPPSAPASR